MRYVGELKIEIDTEAVNQDALDIKLGAIQRALWKNFGNTATMSVSLEVDNTKEILDTYQEVFKPGPELRGM